MKIDNVARQPLAADLVRIAVQASSANFFDLLMMVGKYQSKPPLPFSPGSEASGIVIEVGLNVKLYKVGDEVVCSMAVGCMAEELILPEAMLFPKPKSLTHAEAAAKLWHVCGSLCVI